MTHDKVKLLKPDNKQLGRKALRLMQLNVRFCFLLALLVTTAILVICLNRKLHRQPDHRVSVHQYVKKLLDVQTTPLKHSQNDTADDSYDSDEFDLIWSEETVELFQDQLGIVLSDDDDAVKSLTCRVGEEFVVSALPGVDDQNLSDNLWQYVSLISLESSFAMLSDESEKFSLKAFVTEHMRVVLEQLFEALSLQTLSSLPTSCYNLKYAKIIGNNEPINLKEIAPATAPLLLDPKAKRMKEIAQLFGSKIRPFFRFNEEIMKEVEQEFLVTKTIQEMENEKSKDVNFVAVYITADDKLPIEYYHSAMTFHRKGAEKTIFMIVCDLESLVFCQESFDGKTSAGDVRIIRKSIDNFDFALMSSCNATIVSNDMGVLHALMNGGETTVYKPEPTADPEYYVPWLMSEQMPNFYAID